MQRHTVSLRLISEKSLFLAKKGKKDIHELTDIDGFCELINYVSCALF